MNKNKSNISDALPGAVLGIDVSKKTLDLCLRNADGNHTSFSIPNEPKDFLAFLKEHKLNAGGTLIAMENTGRYNWPIYQALSELGTALKATVFVLCPLSLKRSMGLARGKSDALDARRIGHYAHLHKEELNPWMPAGADLRALCEFLALRDRRVKTVVVIKNSAPMKGERKGIEAAGKMADMDAEMLTLLKSQIKAIEREIDGLIAKSEALKPLYTVIRSVPGAGLVLGCKLLVKTRGFTQLTDPKKLACYAGVVPFQNQSGTSLKGRAKVSFMADKELKKLLHMAAMSVIRLPGELRDYYQRKVAEGKAKMSVLNAIRNKIIHRICAVAKTGERYQAQKINLATS